MAQRKNQQDPKKKLVDVILKQQGKSYDNWINEKHSQLIEENIDLLTLSVELANEKGEKN